MTGSSPQDAIAKVGSDYGVTISKTTCYRYIQMKLFPSLRYKHLPQGHPKKGKGTVSHANVSHPKHRSIEHRAKSIRNREEVGHWELDSVIGKAEGTGESCLVMTDRKPEVKSSSRPGVKLPPIQSMPCNGLNVRLAAIGS